MLYTKQQLIDAYCASEGVLEADLPSIIVTTQAMLDDRILLLTERIARLQVRLSGMDTDAKTHMKKVAIRYLADLNVSQDIIDNDGVNL